MSGAPSSVDCYVTIIVVLPVCLHLDGRTFCLPYKNGTQIEIQTENFFSERETSLGSASGFEIDSDDFSHFRFTRIKMKIPDFAKEPIDQNAILEQYRDVFFRSLNIFIDSVRIALKRYGLRNFHHYDDFSEQVIAKPSEKLNPSGTVSCFISFEKGHLVTAKPLRSEVEHTKIQEMLSQTVTLPEAFISDAKREFYYNNDLHALLNAVIALEIMLSDTIRSIAIKKGVGKGSIDIFLVEVGLSGNLKTTLRLLVPESVELPSNETFQKCQAAITIRNAIAHEGRREISHEEVSDLIDNIESMLRFLEDLS